MTLPLLAVAAFQPGGRLLGYLAACAILSLTLMTGLRAVQTEQFIARHLAQLPSTAGNGPKIVFIDIRKGYYAWDLVQNDPFLRDGARLVSHGTDDDAALMRVYFPQFRLLSAGSNGSVWGTESR
jgi:hypothetical protein